MKTMIPANARKQAAAMPSTVKSLPLAESTCSSVMMSAGVSPGLRVSTSLPSAMPTRVSLAIAGPMTGSIEIALGDPIGRHLVDELGRDFLAGDLDGVEAEDDFVLQQIRAGDHGAVEKALVGGDPAGFAILRESRPAVERK